MWLSLQTDELKAMLVEMVSAHPLYGSHFFHVIKQVCTADGQSGRLQAAALLLA